VHKQFLVSASLMAIMTGSVSAWDDTKRAEDFFTSGIEDKVSSYLTTKVENALDGKVNEFEIDITDFSEGEASFRLLMLKPLRDMDGQSTFLQAGIISQDDVNTINLGVSNRWSLRDGTVLAGLNAFYDNEIDVGHSRASLGAEILTSVGDLRFNSYTAISDTENNEDEDRDEIALDGTELEVALPLPYMPNTRLTLTSFSWDGDEGSEDSEGTITGLRMTLPKGFELEAGSIDYDKEASVDDDYVSLSFNITRYRNAAKYGQPVLVADTAYELLDVTQRRFEKVRRSNTIVKAATGAGFKFSAGTVVGTVDISGTSNDIN